MLVIVGLLRQLLGCCEKISAWEYMKWLQKWIGLFLLIFGAIWVRLGVVLGPRKEISRIGGKLVVAVERGDVKEARELLERGAPVDYCFAYPSVTPLIAAVRSGNTNLVRMLVEEFGADVNKPDSMGLTPLHWAVLRYSGEEHVWIYDFLVANGALTNRRDYHGMGLSELGVGRIEEWRSWRSHVKPSK